MNYDLVSRIWFSGEQNMEVLQQKDCIFYRIQTELTCFGFNVCFVCIGLFGGLTWVTSEGVRWWSVSYTSNNSPVTDHWTTAHHNGFKHLSSKPTPRPSSVRPKYCKCCEMGALDWHLNVYKVGVYGPLCLNLKLRNKQINHQ